MSRFDWLGFFAVSTCAGLLAYGVLPRIVHNAIHLDLFRVPYAVGAGLVIGFVFAWE
jgi:ABC-type phosphate/phosphonate transport system permease subunit